MPTLENFNTTIHLENRIFSGRKQMAVKNAILRHVGYNVVRQAVGKTAVPSTRNRGPTAPQQRPRCTATEAPLHGDGAPVARRWRPRCSVTGAQLRWLGNIVGAHRGKEAVGLWHKFPQPTVSFSLNVQKTHAVLYSYADLSYYICFSFSMKACNFRTRICGKVRSRSTS